MATKTISVDLAAYERLRAARLRPDESFSQVIKRAHWEGRSSARALLEALGKAPVPGKRVLDRLERAQRDDAPPASAWTK
jgi:predicted CopG family antitoxin